MVCVLSIGARVYHLDNPREEQPTKGFVFDEKYYVNAARVIAGVSFSTEDTYNGSSPNGTDPNAEHPQGGKLVIAAGIRLFGDNPIGWRIGAVIFGTLAILAMFWLVLCAGGSNRLALGAASLMAFENLEMLHGRIAVLDVYCLPFMLVGVGLWLRRRWLLAALAVGVGTDMKLFGGYALLVILFYELFQLARWLYERTDPAEMRRFVRVLLPVAGAAAVVVVVAALASHGFLTLAALAGAVVVLAGTGAYLFPGHQLVGRYAGVVGCVVVTLVVLAVLDHFVPAYSNGRRISADLRPWDHLRFIYDYGKDLRSPDGPKGIASYPWQFWIDIEAANYYTYNQFVLLGTQTTSIDTVIAYQGLVNPVLLVLALPTLAMCVWLGVRRRDTISFLVIAWVLGTWLPPFLASALDQRTVYLYYMVVILPGIFLGAARLLSSRVIPRLALGIWVGLFIAAFCILYPFRDWGYFPSFFGFG